MHGPGPVYGTLTTPLEVRAGLPLAGGKRAMLATVMWAMGQSSVVTAGEQTGMASRIPFRTALRKFF